MENTRSLRWTFTIWLLAMLIVIGFIAGRVFVGLFRSVVEENIQNSIESNSRDNAVDVLDYFDRRKALLSLAPRRNYRTLLQGVNERFYFNSPLGADEDSLTGYSEQERQLLNSIAVHPQNSPIDPALNFEYQDFVSWLDRFKRIYPDIIWAFIASERTQDVFSKSYQVDLSHLINRTDWYQQIKRQKYQVVLPPHYDKNSNQFLFIVAMPLFENDTQNSGELLGAYVLMLSYNEFVRNVVNNQWDSQFATSFSYIVDESGVVVHHPNIDLVKNGVNIYAESQYFDPSITQIIDGLQMNDEIEDYQANDSITGFFEGMNSMGNLGKFRVIVRYTGVGEWKLVTIVPNLEIESYMSVRFGNSWVGLIFLAILVVLFIFFLTSHFLSPISNMTDIMKEAGRGNLSIEKTVLRSKMQSRNEVGLLASVIGNALSNFHRSLASVHVLISGGQRAIENLMNSSNLVRGMASNITISLEQAHEGSVELQNGAKRVSEAAGSVRSTIEEESQLVMDSSAAVNQTSVAMEQMNASITNMASIASESRNSSDQLIQVTREGTASMEELTETIESISDNIAQMREVITIINEISQQTNLLAMNAAIEAAHAGESGKGFAVVANEIRQLAETTAENSTSIHNTLTNMVGVMEQARLSSEQSSSTFDQIERQVQKFVQAFGSIANSSEEISIGSQEINNSMGELNNKSNSLLQHTSSVQESVINIERLLSDIDNFAQGNLSRVSGLMQQSLSIEALQKSNARMSRLTFNSMQDLLRQISRFTITQDEQAEFNMQNDFGQLFIELQQKRSEIMEMLNQVRTPLAEDDAGNSKESSIGIWIRDYGNLYFSDYPEFRELVEVHYDFYRLRVELVRLFAGKNDSMLADVTKRFEEKAELIEEKLLALQKIFYSTILPAYIQKTELRSKE